MKNLEELLKNLENIIFRLDIEWDKGILEYAEELLKDSSTFTQENIKGPLEQIKLILKKLKKEELLLNDETIYNLKYLLKQIIDEKNPQEFSESEINELLQDFFNETKKILEELNTQDNDKLPSLLHRLKGTIGIYLNICTNSQRVLGEKFLRKTIDFEIKVKNGISKEEKKLYIKELNEIYKEILGRKDKREYPKNPILGVGIVIFNNNGKFLLIQRNKPPMKGYMSIPGGKVELGESLKDAIKREVKEECNINVDVKDIILITENIQRDSSGKVKYHYILIDFWGLTDEEQITPLKEEIGAWEWVEIKDLKKYKLWEKTKELIEKGYKEFTVYKKATTE